MNDAERAADGQRDALAILAAALAEDFDGVGTVVVNASTLALIAAFVTMVSEVLRGQGTDPADWVAEQQARLRGELAAE